MIGNFHGIFDAETYRQFQIIVGKGNVRKQFEDYMLAVIALHNKDIEGINIQLINLKIEKSTQKMTKMQSELQKLVEIKSKFEENKHKLEENRLEKEKEHIEKLKTCINCGLLLSEKHKFQNFSGGKVCHACFMSCDKDDINRWSEYMNT